VRRVPTRTRLAAALVALVAGAGAVPVAPAGAASTGIVDIVGHGWGHGRGMGQYGALGYAVEHGWSYQQILGHFYGGTAPGTSPDAEIDVRLSRQDGAAMVVTSASPFSIGDNAFAPGEAARVVRRGDGQWEIARAPGACAASAWVPAQVVDGALAPEAVPAADDPGAALPQLLELCRADGNRHYRGRLRIVLGDGAPRTVNRVPMEQYLRGVLPRESPASWGDHGGGRGMQALMAQAVAARSYAWADGVRWSYATTCDTTSCQVYGGAALNGVPAEDHRTDHAVAATAGQVRRWPNGSIVRTEFSSSTGGATVGGQFPAVEDLGDAIALNPNSTWRAQVPASQLEAAYPSIGALVGVDIPVRAGIGPDGGWPTGIVLRGSRGSVTITPEQARTALGLKSGFFRVTRAIEVAPAVGIAARAAGGGFWRASSDGAVFTEGAVPALGDALAVPLRSPVVGLAAAPGDGYWLVGGDGGIFSYGDAPFLGSTGGMALNQPVVGMASTPGLGYWFVAADGGVFSYGDAAFHGSTGGMVLNQPVVGMARTPGSGYWLVARDGGVFAYGDAPFLGSTGGIRLAQPVVGMAATPSGRGYWLVARDGGVFAYGDAPFLGSGADGVPRSPIVGVAASPSGGGYALLAADGTVLRFGDA
jgi:hypothetical protein